MKRVEVLAPAGSVESLYAAINKGADAVYLGGNKFSARAYASNFDNDNMIKAIDYAHSYNVKVYVTLNTILKENEIDEAVRYVGFLYEIGVDAIILQDLGLLKRIKEEFVDLELHASTQMTIHNGEGALYFKEKGFHRLVLAREMSLEEVEFISKDLSIETEMFVHGAICIAYSGQCLMSSVIGGRSGNRGKCAQPCRMEYTLKGETTGERKGYLLSPKDMCTIDDVDSIISSGTHSLKIEGRMKRAEYVAGVVDNYRKAVDKVIYNNKYNSNEGERQLLQLFNRSGFTKAYLHKDTGKDMMSFNSPKNAGVYLGKVDSNGEIILQEEIEIADGVRYRDKGFTLSKITIKGNEVKSANRGDKVKLFPIDYKKGDELFKSLDKSLFDDLNPFITPYYKKINLKGKINFEVEKPIELIVNYKNNEYKFLGEIVQKAEKKPLEKTRIEEALKKSGDVAFKFDNIKFISFEDGFLRVSDLNELRRNALESISKSITKSYRRIRASEKNKSNNKEEFSNVEYVFNCITKEQLNALIDSGIKEIGCDLFSREIGALRERDIVEIKKVHGDSINIYVKTSTIVKGEFDKVSETIKNIQRYISGIITSNVGIINKFKDSLYIIGDYKLNIMNSESLKFYQEDIAIPTLSMELNRSEIKALCKNSKGNKGIIVYGKPELMISEYCPIGSTFGGKVTNKSCNIACSKDRYTLIDRVNEKLRVMTDLFCRSYILNPIPMNLINEIDDLKSLGVNSFRFDFRDESYEEVIDIIKSIGKVQENSNGKFTKGHYRRGVE